MTQAPAATALQGLIWPEIGLCTERDLYVRLSGGAALSLSNREIQFPSGGGADFGTYNNLFNVGKWVKNCGLETLSLRLAGEGRFELVIFLARPERSWERLVSEIVTLGPDAPLVTPIDGLDEIGNRGAVHFELRAMGPEGGVLRTAEWCTQDAARWTPELMLSVTTFRREAAVARTVRRFESFIAGSPLKDHIRMTVVDNGQSAHVPASDHVTLIGNENLGGAGGFSRGLLEAQSTGASHCLFMDDDASVHMEAIERTWMFLAYAENAATAVAGAVANAQHRWKLWENGAIFDHICQPQHMGTDLRAIDEVLEMEFDSTATRPHNFYGGWWYFAFPVDAVAHMPFPFFVRGDDVSFSLVHDFNIVTLPGVISFQDEDFSVKETPLTVYLDLRSHLAHHLSLPAMEIGRAGVARIVARFWIRGLLACHYETLAAVAQAAEDVLAGPEFFAANADMATRRAEIGALTRDERWKPIEEVATGRARAWLPPDRWPTRALMKLTLNGHLLPGFTRIGNRIELPAAQRGARRPLWGAAEITYLGTDGKRAYRVRHDKGAAWKVSRRIAAATWAIWRDYDGLRDRWREGYDTLTRQGFWQRLLKLEPAAETRAAGD